MNSITTKDMKNSRITRILLSGMVVGICSQLAAQNNSDTWAVRAGGTAIEHANALAADKNGNLYVTGGWQIDDGNTEIFLSKYSSEGRLLWNVNSGSDTVLFNTFSEYGADVVVAGDFVYATGTFMASADFSGTMVRSRGHDDIFLAKYSTSGDLLWVRTAGGKSQDLVHSLTTDAEGNIYLTGSFQQEAQFGEHTLRARSGADLFFVKYDASGNLLWSQQAWSDVEGVGKKIRCQADHCFIAGEYRGAVQFEGMLIADEGGKVMLTTIDKQRGHVMDNKIIFSQSHVTVDDFIMEENHTYMTGSFFQLLPLPDQTVPSKGGSDGYLLKLDASGDKIWCLTQGGPYMDHSERLVSDKKGNVFVTGRFQNEIQVNDQLLTGSGADDIFMATVTRDGHVSAIEEFGGIGNDRVKDAELMDGDVIITGYFKDTVAVRTLTLRSAGSSDLLLAKLKVDNKKGETVLEEDISVKVFPNPAKGKFLLTSTDEIHDISVNNVIGQEIAEVKITRTTPREVEIKVEGNFKGVCIVKAVTTRKTFTRKVILE
jgi:hypothetical protein